MLAMRAACVARPTTNARSRPNARSITTTSRSSPLRGARNVRGRASSEDQEDVASNFPEDSPAPGYVAGPFVVPEGAPGFASYTDPTVWKLMQAALRECEVEQVLPAKARRLAEEDGWTLIDVRPYPDYCASHAWGALNAELYAPMQVDSLVKAAKQAATLALFPERALDKYAAVECNASFLDDMQDAVAWGSKVIVYCGTGGVIGQAELNYADGAQTASLIAAHELCARGWGTENVKHMAGGLGMWEEIEGFDVGEVPEE